MKVIRHRHVAGLHYKVLLYAGHAIREDFQATLTNGCLAQVAKACGVLYGFGH